MQLYHVKVLDSAKELYYPAFLLWDSIGYIWDRDEEHIWFKFVKINPNGESYMSGPHRYCYNDIEYVFVPLDFNEYITSTFPEIRDNY